ncbi:2-C-methyl-D-erythritol 2,4-cyclodiphosphate synthase [Patulibacter brassicae]|jgi:2-C-methyl-D-erythritol 2,4-cyclodiphosphate synthase|uniref:2-C-methyl-D-erythritol 2,4-cyclodiphosphate synthase n=1 Tax=Patulibacter brassicae TaxID=1705717 RepID=A0ABU4VPR5_9ACTN|nr:2-C-methyl-D-erythritol 2,4-cyclodiphosphate synthase [Patulibacter brassicae]MDX8153049.1 2-C-methyl-D-erythritol 2,4-cyclodiphosphate synthase [Patulibacter brassicae]
MADRDAVAPIIDVRTGLGWDSHRLVAGRPLILGGVTIESDLGLDGHSDADVLTHAVIDALLGAAGRGDIGEHFPDTDERWRGADSIALLRHVAGLVAGDGWAVSSVDATIVLERPKLASHKAAMAARIAETLGIDAGRVGVKATTAERLDAVGRREGAVAQAVATIVRHA